MTNVLFEVNQSRDFKASLITDGCRFCNIKETDNNHLRWQSFQFRFNRSAKKIVCNRL